MDKKRKLKIGMSGAMDLKPGSTCFTHKLKAIKVGNPMIYQCLNCGQKFKSKKEKNK